MKISITQKSNDDYQVTVHAAQETTHRVTCTPEMINRYAPDSQAEDLIRASFKFLLERESNTMIMSAFALPVIESYFPEYPKVIGSMISE